MNSEPRRLHRLAATVLVATAVLVSMYVGAYYALIESPMSYRVRARGTVVEPIVTYRYGGTWALHFFDPICRIDQQLRPEFWGTDDPDLRSEIEKNFAEPKTGRP